MFLTHDPTQPNKKLKISTQPNQPTQPSPTQPNPTRGSTQPMDNSVLITGNGGFEAFASFTAGAVLVVALPGW